MQFLVLLYDQRSAWLLFGEQPCSQIQAADAASHPAAIGFYF